MGKASKTTSPPPSLPLRRNVLIFHAGALGDFVLTWPLALALGRLYPQSRIIYVTAQQKGRLAQKALRVESTDMEAGWHALHGDATTLPPPAMKLLTGAHSILNFANQSEDRWHANVKSLAPSAELITLTPKVPTDSAKHITEHYLDQLTRWPATHAAVQQILRSVHDRGVGYRLLPGGGVVIHPGSGSPVKCWPLERFLELAMRWKSQGQAVRFLIGEVERERWGPEKVKTLCATGTVVEPQSYVDLLAELSTADVFVGNDSGPGHLAAIIGVPSVSLFGPTDPIVWRPLGPRCRVLAGKTLEEISIDQIFEAAEHLKAEKARVTPAPLVSDD